MMMMGTKVVIREAEPEFVVVRRAWRKRLLSWPWRPWVSTTVVNDPVARARNLTAQLAGDTIFMTRKLFDSIKTDVSIGYHRPGEFP